MTKQDLISVIETEYLNEFEILKRIIKDMNTERLIVTPYFTMNSIGFRVFVGELELFDKSMVFTRTPSIFLHFDFCDDTLSSLERVDSSLNRLLYTIVQYLFPLGTFELFFAKRKPIEPLSIVDLYILHKPTGVLLKYIKNTKKD